MPLHHVVDNIRSSVEVGLEHEKSLYPENIADLVFWLVTCRANVKIGAPILIQTVENPWRSADDAVDGEG